MKIIIIIFHLFCLFMFTVNESAEKNETFNNFCENSECTSETRNMLATNTNVAELSLEKKSLFLENYTGEAQSFQNDNFENVGLPKEKVGLFEHPNVKTQFKTETESAERHTTNDDVENVSKSDLNVKSIAEKINEYENATYLKEITDTTWNETSSESELLFTNTVEPTTENYSKTKDTTLLQSDKTKKNFFSINYSSTEKKTHICVCDLKYNECDINCCCDNDCNADMMQIFSGCDDSIYLAKPEVCYDSKLSYKSNRAKSNNGLFCIVKNNLNLQLFYKEEHIIKNVSSFRKNILGKKVFSYSMWQFSQPKMHNASYRMGDFVWSLEQNKIVPFGIPTHNVNFHCTTMKNIHYLSETSTKCLQVIPSNKEECEHSIAIQMHHYLRNVKIIKSPALIKRRNSTDSDKICSREACVDIMPYVCFKNSDCVKSSIKPAVWEKTICKNIVTAVRYEVFHSGDKGITEIRALFELSDLGKVDDKQFTQTINLKFIWSKSPSETFVRSGNPGYLVGKPIMAGRKIFYNNETAQLKKEAIELSMHPAQWLTVFGSKDGICTSDSRKTINFGENAHHSCFVEVDKSNFTKGKCIDLQKNIFSILLGDYFTDIKLNNYYNKFVATLGNSKVEETGDWVQVLMNTLPIFSTQVGVTFHFNGFVCYNIVTDLFIDIAFSKIGSFEKPQSKILGVHYHFGSLKKLTYRKSSNFYNRKPVQMIRLSSFIQFIDVTNNSFNEFAETPGFEAKIPYDFFYPFIGRSSLLYPNYTLFIILWCFCTSV